MGKAKVKASLSHISMEIMSASSALHMMPEPIDGAKGEFLVAQDAWAKHSAEHTQAALRSVNELRTKGKMILRNELRELRELGLVEFHEDKIRLIVESLMSRLDEGEKYENNSSD